MKIYKYTLRAFACVFVLVLAVACTNDFGDVGTGLVGVVNFETRQTMEIDVVAYTKTIDEGVQTNALPVGAMGFYKDNVYGETTASVLTQLALSRLDPVFGEAPILDSAYFSLPYFSRLVERDDDGNGTYELDSIFRNTGPMKLSVYRSNYFLNNLDPETDFQDPAVYYSNDIENFAGIEGDLLFQIDEFVPSNEEVVLRSIDSVCDSDQGFLRIDTTFVRRPPELRVRLDSLYFTQNIIERQGDEMLLNQNNFNDYFRGIYIKAESIDNKGSYILFDYTQASLSSFYRFTGSDDTPSDDGGSTSQCETKKGSLRLGLGGVQIIDLETEYTPEIEDAYTRIDTVNGDESLYLKGGDGSIALIDLFGPDFDQDENQVEDQLEALRACNVIINEANLIFYVDQEKVAPGSGVAEPERVFIYDFDNNATLIDGEIDLTSGFNGAVGTRVNHLGRIVRDTEGDESTPGVSYRIRLTQHINNIINNDSTNVRLALAVTQNVTTLNSAIIGGTLDADRENIERLPVGTVLCQESTILHGSKSPNETKRLKLILSYTLTEEIDPDSVCGRLLGLR
ncbi:MAG: hypothetical protein ACI828_000992 [Flavobacteriales bacterium]|jgi:hypothetical protein